ncbi:hybrid sensor histidine kinase/response regulator, partial [Halorubrum ezzemoulense]
SIVSHDLRNPLNVAQGRVQLAQDAVADGGDENLSAALDALDRMESIVERTLTLAREGETVGDPEPVDLAAVVTDSWSTVDTADASLSIETEREVLADSDRLRNLFENLMRNAVDHVGPTVSIRVGDLPDGFFVEDDGPGIDPAVADSLFEPGESGTAGNTGFGLAIVQEIATAHG